MRPEYIPALLLFAFLAPVVRAADEPQPALTVAVYDFTGEADAASYARKASSLVTADLAGNTNVITVERAQLSTALSEEAFGISGIVNSEAAAKIGQLTGAKVLVSGQWLRPAMPVWPLSPTLWARKRDAFSRPKWRAGWTDSWI